MSNVRVKRNELREKSVNLKSSLLEIDNLKQAEKIAKEQNKIYKKFNFYDKLIKAIEKEEK